MSGDAETPTQDATWDENAPESGDAKKPGRWGRAVSASSEFPNVDLFDAEVVFGRKSTCQVKFNHPAISGQHCSLLRREDGVVFLKDLSTNGTFVDGKKVGKNNQHVVSNGSEIVLIRTGELKISYTVYLGEDDKKGPVDGPEEKYQITDTLGTGAFATVKLAIDKKSGTKYAIKIIEKKRFQLNHGTQRANALMDEVNILKKLSHKNIIKIFDVYETEAHLYLVLELVTGGDLFDQIVGLKGKAYPEERARDIFNQMAGAVQHLHRNNIAHRDLKPENILIAEKGKDIIKLSDFGLSRIVGEGSFMKTLCGTPQYLAPEVLLPPKSDGQHPGYDKAVDLWSLGVILYILLSGVPPFKDDKTILEQVKQAKIAFPPKYFANVSETAIDLVKRLLAKEPGKRIPITEAESHPWVQGFRTFAESKNKSMSTGPDLSSEDKENNKTLPLDSNNDSPASANPKGKAAPKTKGQKRKLEDEDDQNDRQAMDTSSSTVTATTGTAGNKTNGAKRSKH